MFGVKVDSRAALSRAYGAEASKIETLHTPIGQGCVKV